MASQGGPGGPGKDDRRRWEDRFTEAGTRVEDELRRVMRYIDEEVVPEIRRNGSSALRFASAELERLARHMDDRRAEDATGGNASGNASQDAARKP